MMEQLNLKFSQSSFHIPLWTNINDKWATMLWKKLEKNVLNIQKRIYKAIKAGKIGKAKKLARLLLRSTSSIILNVRRVTQDNKGKRTAGVDGVKMLTPKQRLELVNKLILQAKKSFEGYKAKPIRRVYVPKPNGEKRPLGIPTMEDRAIQGIVKSSLEPIWEARFEPYSYGFRPAHSTHDAIELIFKSLKVTQKWVLEADIKGCFDNINHEKLLEKLDATATQKRMIRQMLKAGCMDNQEFSSTELGTPQGGIISPVLANIALDGLETYLYSELSKKYKAKELYRKKFRLVRYADDFVILYPDQEVIIDSKRIVQKLNPIIRGWANYYNHQVSKKTFSNLDYLMWIKLWSWSKRRHGEKSKCWIAKKYFKPIGKKKWCFATKENVLANHCDTKIVRHVMVKTGKSYYDGDETYWAKRLSKGYGNISPSKAKLLKQQNGKCNFCDSQFRNEDLMETHHVIMKKDGGKREYKNLVLIHKHCHDQLHGKK